MSDLEFSPEKASVIDTSQLCKNVLVLTTGSSDHLGAVMNESLVSIQTVLSQENARYESISTQNLQEFFGKLCDTLAMKENNHKSAPDFSVISQALLKNPIMLFKLLTLQRAGAMLIVSSYVNGEYIEFTDIGQLDVEKQVAALHACTHAEKMAAIEKLVERDRSIPEGQKSAAKALMQKHLQRPNDAYAKGINYFEALLYANMHGGEIISQKTYETYGIARLPDGDGVWTWLQTSQSKSLHAFLSQSSAEAPYGILIKSNDGKSPHCTIDALTAPASSRNFDEDLGVRVSGLKIEL